MGKEILINQMYAGGFLEVGNNIGHEVINLFKADDGKNYVYVTPSGKVPKERDVEMIFFVRNIAAKKTMEVVSVAKSLKRVTPEKAAEIKYDGVETWHIFQGNTEYGDKDSSDPAATYCADEVLVPRGGRRLVLTVDDDCREGREGDVIMRLDTTKEVVVSQALRGYYPETEKSYEQLEKQMSKDTVSWGRVEEKAPHVPGGCATRRQKLFLEVIRKEYDELTFSNLLAYYFEYDREAFQRFAKEVLGIPGVDVSFEVIRESKYNIDLWIEDENRIVVIENKIKSGISGVRDGDYSQLKKYYERAILEAEQKGKGCSFFVFAPVYNAIDLTKYDHGCKYTLVNYNKIYRFFSQNADAYRDDKYFPDFLAGLRKHTLTSAELHYETMRMRFLDAIGRVK